MGRWLPEERPWFAAETQYAGRCISAGITPDWPDSYGEGEKADFTERSQEESLIGLLQHYLQ